MAGAPPAAGRIFCTVSKSHTCKATAALLTFHLVGTSIPGWLQACWVSLPEAFGMWKTTPLSTLMWLQHIQAKWEPMAVRRNLSLWIGSPAWDSFVFQPTYLLLKKVSSGPITENVKRLFLSLNGHVTSSYRRKVSVFSLSHCQSSCCFNPCGTEQLSERACVLLQLHPQWQLKIIWEGDN